MTAEELKVIISADASKLNNALSGAENKLTGFATKINPVVATVGTLITSITAVGLGMFMLGQKVDKAQNIIIKGTGASGDALQGLMDDMRAVNRQVPESMDVVAGAIQGLNTRLGLTGEELQEVTKLTLEFARINDTDVSASVRQVTRLMKDWGVEDTAKTMDLLTKVAQDTGASVESLAEEAVTFGVQFRALGYDMTETVALLGQFEREGVASSKVTSGFSIALGQLSKQGGDLAENFRDTLQSIKDLDESSAIDLARSVFGGRGGADMALAIRENRFEIDDLVESLGDYSGVTEETAWATMELGDRMALLGKRITTHLEPTALALVDRLKDLVDVGMIFVDGVMQGFRDNIDPVNEALGLLKDALGDLFPPLSSLEDEMNNGAFVAGEKTGRELANIITEIINIATELVSFAGENKQEIKELFKDGLEIAKDMLGIYKEIAPAIGFVVDQLRNTLDVLREVKKVNDGIGNIASKGVGTAKGWLNIGGGYQGGEIKGYQSGGFVSGVKIGTGRDNILVRAEEGEVILNKKQQQGLMQTSGNSYEFTNYFQSEVSMEAIAARLAFQIG